jgi:hypothetical protein
MVTLGTIYLILKILATLLTITVSSKKIFEWLRNRNKQKPTG